MTLCRRWLINKTRLAVASIPMEATPFLHYSEQAGGQKYAYFCSLQCTFNNSVTPDKSTTLGPPDSPLPSSQLMKFSFAAVRRGQLVGEHSATQKIQFLRQITFVFVGRNCVWVLCCNSEDESQQKNKLFSSRTKPTYSLHKEVNF